MAITPEEFEQDPIIYTPLVSTKAKFEVLDPTGVVTETHEFEFKAAYWAGRAVLTLGDNLWMVTGSGKNIRRIGEEPQKPKVPEKPKKECCHHVLRQYQQHKCEIKEKNKTCKGCHYFYI